MTAGAASSGSRANRWAKHAAERDAEIQSAAIALQVLLPEIAEGKIQQCLRENSGDADIAWKQLQTNDQASPHAPSESDDDMAAILAAIEIAERADVANEAPSSQESEEEARSVLAQALEASEAMQAPVEPMETSPEPANVPQAPVEETEEVISQDVERPVGHEFSEPDAREWPKATVQPEALEETPVKASMVQETPRVPDWLPLLKPKLVPNARRSSNFDRQTERLKAALGPAPKPVSVPSAHDLDVRGKTRGGG
ncbi:unnamed protein product [Effrenium voratum]|uniref:Uncharacterized protein n=1 Tax=Effrenium voratum TaxID=2562239 RepID=A0AA36MZ30_9DINO|nr:unnamed protein product [Effrenium voratum]